MIALLWAKLGKWIALVGAAIAAVLTALLVGRHRGAQAQAAKNATHDAQAEVQAAQETQATVADASTAAAQVRDTAAAQPTPDAAKRNDFDDTF